MFDATQTTDAAFARYESVRARLPTASFPAFSHIAENLSDVADRYDAFVLDAFGVLNVGPSVTLNLDTQFIGAGRIDEPLDAVTELVRETGRLVFLRGMVVQGESDRDIVATYSGTIRKASKAG